MNRNLGLSIDAPGRVSLADVPLPEPAPDELLVRVRHVALCGSDVKLYLGSYSAPHKYPIVMGHEWVGEVERAGAEAASSWSAGDVVVGDCSLYCGACAACATDRNQCLRIEKRGITRDGACARRIVVNQRHVYRCPRLADLRPLALCEPLAVAVQGILNRVPGADLGRVRNALVIGAGGIGAMSLLALAEFSIPRVTIVDPLPAKLSIAASLGLANVVTVASDLSAGGAEVGGGFDLIVEAAGSGPALSRAFELASSGARIVCLGHQGKLELDFGIAIRKSLSVFASIGSTGGFEKAVEIVTERHAAVSRLITRVVPLEAAPQFFREGLRSPDDVKVLIDVG